MELRASWDPSRKIHNFDINPILVVLSSLALSPLCGKPPARCSTTRLRMSLTFPVREALSLTLIDEIKWQLRMPTRFAMREIKLSYLDKVQENTIEFLGQRIKHNFIQPDSELSLDLTIKEAEILILANQEVRELAENG